MKKISLLIPSLMPMIVLIGCSLSKQEIVDKCLLQANQTFPTDMTQNSMFFQGCMVRYKYAFNAHNCDKDKQDHMLSEICYVKY
jgi:hypothetical protein